MNLSAKASAGVNILYSDSDKDQLQFCTKVTHRKYVIYKREKNNLLSLQQMPVSLMAQQVWAAMLTSKHRVIVSISDDIVTISTAQVPLQLGCEATLLRPATKSGTCKLFLSFLSNGFGVSD